MGVICEFAGGDPARRRSEIGLIEALRDRARDTVARLPAPEPDAHPGAYATWEWDMMEAAEALAADFGDDDGRLLADAVGPPIQVGAAPAWHVLLQIALLYAEANQPISLSRGHAWPRGDFARVEGGDDRFTFEHDR